jgi:hypothetical protein
MVHGWDEQTAKELDRLAATDGDIIGGITKRERDQRFPEGGHGRIAKRKAKLGDEPSAKAGRTTHWDGSVAQSSTDRPGETSGENPSPWTNWKPFKWTKPGETSGFASWDPVPWNKTPQQQAWDAHAHRSDALQAAVQNVTASSSTGWRTISTF